MERISNELPEASVDSQRTFFGCEDWSDDDLDAYAEYLETLPGGEWMKEVSPTARRHYAMSCVWLKDQNNILFQDQIVHGRVWLTYG